MTTLSSILQDLYVEDIVLRPDCFFFFKKGSWFGPYALKNDTHLTQKLFRMAEEASQSNLGMTTPSADTYLELTESLTFRVHLVVAPMSQSTFEMTLRRISRQLKYSLHDFTKHPQEIELLKSHLKAGSSILVAGATGSGKTSFLNALLKDTLLETKRLLILEDTPELQLPNALSCKLLTRHNRYKHRLGAQWDLENLLFESLRMRPDRIILGECRSQEAKAVKLAIQTGHGGVMSTIHAGNCTQAIERFNELADTGGIKRTVDSSPWHIVVHLKGQTDGSKKIEEILCPAQATPLKYASCE